MPNQCAVSTCASRGGGGGLSDGNLGTVTFFRFPKDPARRAIWVNWCRRLDLFDPEQTRVCSLHFVKEDFDPSYFVRRSMGFVNSKPVLKPEASPSVNLPASHIM